MKNAVYAGTIITHYRTQHANFQQPTPWPFPCTAGETTAVIDYNGDVRACELREKFASLADFDYDFGALWAASERQTELSAIDGGKACWCTHVCFIHDSMRHSRRALLYEVPQELPDARKLVNAWPIDGTRTRIERAVLLMPRASPCLRQSSLSVAWAGCSTSGLARSPGS